VPQIPHFAPGAEQRRVGEAQQFRRERRIHLNQIAHLPDTHVLAIDQGENALREATLALDQVRRIALDVADGAVQVLGGHGYIRDYLPELQLRNARGFASFEALALV